MFLIKGRCSLLSKSRARRAITVRSYQVSSEAYNCLVSPTVLAYISNRRDQNRMFVPCSVEDWYELLTQCPTFHPPHLHSRLIVKLYLCDVACNLESLTDYLLKPVVTWWHLGVLRRQKLSLTINYFLCLFNYSCFFTNTPSKTSSSRLKPLRQYIYWVLRDLMSRFFLKSLFSLPPDSDSESFLPLTNLMNTLKNSGKT